ncbi:hypothetical protein DM860_015540 [Cuscuta australis]|uniref:DUF4283 domain-containing protein n=1 Tax=Cuscuta australis TaxID=267555 RepID=A0A328DHY7_9ASTE|nr:hypothetical protein DM860_015540 [Cuscuta australis]
MVRAVRYVTLEERKKEKKEKPLKEGGGKKNGKKPSKGKKSGFPRWAEGPVCRVLRCYQVTLPSIQHTCNGVVVGVVQLAKAGSVKEVDLSLIFGNYAWNGIPSKVNGFYKGAPSVMFSREEAEVLAGKLHNTLVGRWSKKISLAVVEQFLVKGGFKEFKLRRLQTHEIVFIFKRDNDYLISGGSI